LGGATLDGEALGNVYVKIPLKTLNRHGLIAGAAGAGKTKIIQVLSEQLSSFGIAKEGRRKFLYNRSPP
jgi:DNA helicase HerA-like ATPase